MFSKTESPKTNWLSSRLPTVAHTQKILKSHSGLLQLGTYEHQPFPAKHHWKQHYHRITQQLRLEGTSAIIQSNPKLSFSQPNNSVFREKVKQVCACSDMWFQDSGKMGTHMKSGQVKTSPFPGVPFQILSDSTFGRGGLDFFFCLKRIKPTFSKSVLDKLC